MGYQYLTPDEIAYVGFSLIDRAEMYGISFNSINEAMGLRYLVASYYFKWIDNVGGRYLIFVANALVLISVLFIFWRDSRQELSVDPVKFFAILFLLPSVLFFSLTALRDIYIYAIAIFMLNRVGRYSNGFDFLITGVMLIFFLISPFNALLSSIAFFLCKVRFNTARVLIIVYYVLFFALMLTPYIYRDVKLSGLMEQILYFGEMKYLSPGVLGNLFSNNATIIFANLSLVLMPYLLLDNVVGLLDWAFFIQSVFMLALMPFFIRKVFQVRVFIFADVRFRYSIFCMLLIYPIFFREKDASTMIRHSMVLFPYFVYIALAAKKMIWQK